MTTPAFRVVERFSSSDGDGWRKYVEWSGLTQLAEVVGLDALLCPSVFDALRASDWDDSDWKHLVFFEELRDCFGDLEYLERRVGHGFDPRRHQCLAVAREPSESDVAAVHLPGFRFMGFDLIDESTAISALTNCGGFPEAFDKAELSASGLIESASRAYAIRDSLAAKYPDESHAQCAVWALWRRETD